MTAFQEVEVSCATCHLHPTCRSIEAEHGPELDRNGGNWRALRNSVGVRIDSPIRRCVQAILEKHTPKFTGARVLEIGCGPASALTDAFCEANQVTYTGLDPDRLPDLAHSWLPFPGFQNRVYGKLLRLGHMPRRGRKQFLLDYFPSPKLHGMQFDLIYGASTLEHWHENLTDRAETVAAYRKDMKVCFDLLAPGGILLIDMPLHVHGNEHFIRGDEALARDILDERWSSVTLERWRRRHDDLRPYRPEGRVKHFGEKYGFTLENIWLLNIVASK